MAVPVLAAMIGATVMKSVAKAQSTASASAASPAAPAVPAAGDPSLTVDPGSKTSPVGGGPLNEANANLGRAALISTSPLGVLGADTTGRRRLLGN